MVQVLMERSRPDLENLTKEEGWIGHSRTNLGGDKGQALVIGKRVVCAGTTDRGE